MEFRKVKGLIQLFGASNLAEVEVTLGGCAIRVSREGGHALQPQPPSESQSRLKIEASTAAVAAPVSSVDSARGDIVRSPMVGITYLSASQDQPPFVAVGTAVKRGDTLGVVATLSTSNRIEAATSGTVVDVLVTNGQPVEFDQPLFVIR